jgi:hypothetical protein
MKSVGDALQALRPPQPADTPERCRWLGNMTVSVKKRGKLRGLLVLPGDSVDPRPPGFNEKESLNNYAADY